MKYLLTGLCLIALCRCASLENSIGLGAGVGAVGGFTSAQLAHYNTKGNVVLTLTGAALGGAIGVGIDILFRKSKAEPSPLPVPTLPPLSKLKDSPPLKNAEKDVILVPDRIEGDTFEEAHRLFVIKKPAHWQLKDGAKREDEDFNE